MIRYLKNRNPRKIGGLKKILIIVLTIFNFLVIFRTYDFNVLKMFVRAEDVVGVTTSEMSTSSKLIFSFFLRPMNMLLFLSCYVLKIGGKMFHAYLLFAAVVTLFPTAVPRFSLAATYIPLMLITMKVFKKKDVFVLLLSFALLVVWPFLNQFRYFTTAESVSLKLDLELFEAGDMDTFSSLLRVMKFDIVTYGNQLLGNIFFFVPRSIWQSKPDGSGSFLCDQCSLTFDNISCNYFAEGYINFGFIGILLFTFFMAFISAKLDGFYWREKNGGLSDVFYCLCIGFIIFILRGDILSAISYFIGFSLSLFVVSILLTKKARIQSLHSLRGI